MLRRCLILLLALVPLGIRAADSSLLPKQIGNFKKSDQLPAPELDPALANEFGLVSAESVRYGGARPFTVTAYRLKDHTGAVALWQAFQSEDGIWRQTGNYVLHFTGIRPGKALLADLETRLPGLAGGPPPPLTKYLPRKGLIAKSERYALGPGSLQRFEPRIAGNLVRFDLGAEAQLARYRVGQSNVDLAIFSYPTPQMARQLLPVFEKLEGAIVKRSGPLVAVAFGPQEAASQVLGPIEYRAKLVMNEPTRDYDGNPGDLLIAIFEMTGYILLFCIGAGLLVAGVRRLSDRIFGSSDARDPMTLLHLEDK